MHNHPPVTTVGPKPSKPCHCMVSFFFSLVAFFVSTLSKNCLQMSLSLFLFWLVSIPFSISAHHAPSPADPTGFLLNCGATNETTVGGLQWTPDEGFINTGNITTLETPGLMPIVATLRFFPDTTARKYCYELPAVKGKRYMVRTTYYHGGYDGSKEPPVFDQIIDGTIWGTVDTTEDYANGQSSFYEIIIEPKGDTLSICLARNNNTKTCPFINAIEMENLEDTMYNSTDFAKHALISVARNGFGYEGDLISYPDDPFNRYWQSFKDTHPTVEAQSNVTSSDFWNLPPPNVFQNGLTTSRGKTLSVKWPPVSLPSSYYYISLYFQDNRTPSPYSWRVFDVNVNGLNFYKGLNVTTSGAAVLGTRWPLGGVLEINLIPAIGSPVGPIINAGEIFQIINLGGRTITRDYAAMQDVAKCLTNPPADWRGDPCLPIENAWTGVTCSMEKRPQVTALNLTGLGLSGTLSSSIANLSSLTDLWLGGNKLTGPIPDLSNLDALIALHLEDNKFKGSIPKTLGELSNLHQIYLQNNNLDGHLPESLKKRPGIDIKVTPGNYIMKSA